MRIMSTDGSEVGETSLSQLEISGSKLTWGNGEEWVRVGAGRGHLRTHADSCEACRESARPEVAKVLRGLRSQMHGPYWPRAFTDLAGVVHPPVSLRADKYFVMAIIAHEEPHVYENRDPCCALRGAPVELREDRDFVLIEARARGAAGRQRGCTCSYANVPGGANCHERYL